jgi:glucose-6-phosphate 1-dehydrogenase
MDGRCCCCSCCCRTQNSRCAGVPFLMKAGKGLDERTAEVRVRFKPPRNGWCSSSSSSSSSAPLPGNELVMRIQPDEACYLTTYSKEPGLSTVAKPTQMEMKWSTQFEGCYVGDAYEKMLLAAAKGDGSMFVGQQELVQAWRIFTPLLHAIDAQKPMPVLYPFGAVEPGGFMAW